ncbi:Ig-like domain-containing protein [Methyloterricola oryzae]|uniref:Ig-like domain-containing protein n=1 Tax=Methyloterricola oryzae TaxID=1495050 RepID=UPI0011AEE08F|nr:Ig-like domain-containing protein [Methyloterricola oryzae]
MAHAVLRDHGPNDATVIFPQWYRDFNDNVLGICKYADSSANGPLCLTTPADTDPAGFAGNLGGEAFYSAFNFNDIGNNINFNYVAALEMAYLSATGAPPAIRDPANPTEVVFSRIRMRMDVPDGCGGHYIIRHPFGTNEFDLEPGTRSLNYTDDVTPINGDFSAAHKGHHGPFLSWDTDLPIIVPQPVGPAHEYIGDPNVLHTYTGSAVPNTGAAKTRHPEHDFQNFIEIEGPTGCDLGQGSNVFFSPLGSLSGIKWTQPIPTATRIEKATYAAKTGSTNAMDIWATSSPGQNLVVTAANDQSPSVPGVRLKENDTPSGTYFAHLEFAGDPPPLVKVTNLSSTPASQDTASVVDAIDITKAIYDPNSHVLCVTAHSESTLASTPASLEAPPYGVFGAPNSNCPAVDPKDVALVKDLDDFLERVSPPQSVNVRSSLGGSDSKTVISLTGVSDATITTIAQDDLFSVTGTGQSPLNVGQNDSGAPTNYRVVVVSQPETEKNGEVVPSGTVSAPASGGTVTYTAAEGLPTHDTSFFYAIQDVVTNKISNVAKVSLHVDAQAAPPVGVADNFGILNSTVASFTANVLTNDSTGAGSVAINPATIKVESQGTRGVATVNTATGAITYRPCKTSAPGVCTTTLSAPGAGTDTFTYSVANIAGARSTPVTVTVVVEPLAEALTVTRARFNSPKWDIRLTDTWFGAPLTPSVSCYLIKNNNTSLPTAQLIGTGPVDPLGAVQIQASAGGSIPSASGTWQIRCTSSNNGTVVSGPVK